MDSFVAVCHANREVVSVEVGHLGDGVVHLHGVNSMDYLLISVDLGRWPHIMRFVVFSGFFFRSWRVTSAVPMNLPDSLTIFLSRTFPPRRNFRMSYGQDFA